jgi:hypothetical protein
MLSLKRLLFSISGMLAVSVAMLRQNPPVPMVDRVAFPTDYSTRMKVLYVFDRTVRVLPAASPLTLRSVWPGTMSPVSGSANAWSTKTLHGRGGPRYKENQDSRAREALH